MGIRKSGRMMVLMSVLLGAPYFYAADKKRPKERKTIRQKIQGTREQVAKIGDQMIAGSQQLKDAADLLRTGRDQLDKELITGLDLLVKGQISGRLQEIKNNRNQIARFQKILQKQYPIADAVGKGALFKDLLAGLQEVGAVLALLYDDQGAVPTGVLVDFMTASDRAVTRTKELVKQLDGDLVELNTRLNKKDWCGWENKKRKECTLPERLERLGVTLKKRAKKEDKEPWFKKSQEKSGFVRKGK